MIPIIDRYLLVEVLKSLTGFLLVLLLVVIGTSFVRYLGDVAAGEIPAQILLPVIGVEVLRFVGLLIPPAFFFAVLLTLGRMYRDSEIIALEASGVGPLRMFRSVLIVSLPVAAVVAWLAVSVLPWGQQMIKLLENRAAGVIAELAGVEAGSFNEYSRGDVVVYVETLDPKSRRMGGIFVQNREHGRVGLITAAEGYHQTDPQTEEQYVVLAKGRRYEGTIGQADYRIGEFDRYALRLTQGHTEQVSRRRKTLPTRELWDSQEIKDRAQLHGQ